ncbi:MAG: DUF6691 family protein [Burkholderiaceae bacterium]
MIAPFYKAGAFSEETSLVLAFVLGLGFGWFLERAGFGSAKKLTSQFYGNDMSVFKVMFTAIITAMAGVTLLSAMGVLDRSQIYLVPTFLVPQLVGGLIFGVGFITGGYCPGTCIAGIATGHKDAAMYGLGMLVGVLAFSALFPSIEPLTQVTSMGKLTLSDLFGLSYGTLTVLVVLIAVGGFVGATVIERRLAAR